MRFSSRGLGASIFASLGLAALSLAACATTGPIESDEIDEPGEVGSGAVDDEADVAEAASPVTITRKIPLRFIHLKDCTNPADCDVARSSIEGIYAAVDRANDVFEAAGIQLWVKSNEVIHAPTLDSQVAQTFSWNQVALDLQRIFPAVETDDYLPLTFKTNRYWLAIGAAYYGDPDVVHVFMVDKTSENGLTEDKDNFAQFPDKGRSVHMIGLGGTSLAHELGHYFGLEHTHGGLTSMVNPATGSPWTRADRWDLYYCASSTPMFYSSRQDYLLKEVYSDTCPDSLEQLIDTDAGNECTSGPAGEGPFTCNLPAGPFPMTAQVTSSSGLLKGLFREDPNVTHNPPAVYKYSANVMGYGTNWLKSMGTGGLDGGVPRFISDSQLDIVETYLQLPALYAAAQVSAFGPMPSDAPYGNASYRNVLGLSTEDSVSWANGTAGSPQNTAFSFVNVDEPVSSSSYKTATGDFDGDGRDDILWCSTQTTYASIWWGNANRTFTKQSVSGFCPSGTGAIRVGRFNQGNAEDILFYVPGSGTDYIKFGSTSRTFTSVSLSVSGTSYVPVVGNFDNQNCDDIFWYKPSDGIVNRWYSPAGCGVPFNAMDNYPVDAGGPWTPIAGNFDGAQGDDIFWYKPGGGGDRVWYSNSSTGFTKVYSQDDVTGTYIPFAGDFDGDGKDDIYWDKSGSPVDHIWSGAGQSTQFIDHDASMDGTFAPFAGDFDGDGLSDVFWYRQ
ncbi:MAG: FG-GAP-like repeat-containing protein [Polyangiaceae bacterium]